MYCDYYLFVIYLSFIYIHDLNQPKTIFRTNSISCTRKGASTPFDFYKISKVLLIEVINFSFKILNNHISIFYDSIVLASLESEIFQRKKSFFTQ